MLYRILTTDYSLNKNIVRMFEASPLLDFVYLLLSCHRRIRNSFEIDILLQFVLRIHSFKKQPIIIPYWQNPLYFIVIPNIPLQQIIYFFRLSTEFFPSATKDYDNKDQYNLELEIHTCLFRSFVVTARFNSFQHSSFRHFIISKGK